MADQRILSTERLVGAGHATLADTLNRLALVEHNNDGTHKWGGKLLAYQHTTASHTGDTLETILFSATVPGGTLGPNGVLDITTLASIPSTANIKTLKVKFGGVVFLNLAYTTGIQSLQQKMMIRNRNSESSQVAAAATQLYSFGYPNAAVLTAAINTAVDQTLQVTGQLAVATDTITLEDMFAEVLRA